MTRIDAVLALVLCGLAAGQDGRSPQAPAIGTSRYAGSRFTTDELDAARRSSERSGGWGSDLGIERRWYEGYRWGELAPGLKELLFRFGQPSRKLEILAEMRTGRPLSPGDAQSLRVCLWDLDPMVQETAAHILLDAGVKLEIAELREASAGRAAPLGALMRLGDPVAAAEVRNAFEEQRVRGYQPERLLALAAFGSADLLPLVRPFLEAQHQNAVLAWARLGGPVEELAPRMKDHPGAFVWDELLEAGTPAALKLIEAHLPRPVGLDDGHFLRRIWTLIAVGREADARRILVSLGSPEKGFVPTFGPHVAYLCAFAGVESAWKELLRLDWTESAASPLTSPSGAAFASSRDPRVVDVLVAALLATSKGFGGDCGSVRLGIGAVTQVMLARRPASERPRILELLDQAPEGARYEGTALRWVLGVRPEPKALLSLAYTELPEWCALSWKPIAHEYAAVLPKLLEDPRKHWFALALLGEESVVEELGRWMHDILEKEPNGVVVYPATALRIIGGKNALEVLYQVAGQPFGEKHRNADYVARAVERLESPGNWKRLADLSTPARDPHGMFLQAAVRLLGKRP